jgi:hypothetical protein
MDLLKVVSWLWPAGVEGGVFTAVKSAPTKACSTPRNIVIGMIKSWLGSFSSFSVMASSWKPESPVPLPSRIPSLYLRNYKEANSNIT